MKKLFTAFCLLIGSLSLMAQNDTINLAEAQYGIDDAQANYYTSGGQTYYTFIISNYDDEVPELRLETSTDSKTLIQGEHSVILDANLSSLTLWIDEVETELTLQFAHLWLRFTGKNIDGDAEYDILSLVKASDGRYYSFSGNLPVYAYDYDNMVDEVPTIIELQDTLDESIVAPEWKDEKDGDDTPTGISNLQFNEAQCQKIFIDGHLYILRGEKVYTITGIEVK